MYVEQVEEFVPTLRWRFMVELWRRICRSLVVEEVIHHVEEVIQFI